MARKLPATISSGASSPRIVIHPRAYQLEMLEASRKGNIIVAMDTGTGKTQIALLRIMEELEKGLGEKRIWLLAPGVALCTQHYESMTSQMPAVGIKLLLGSDHVDRWSDQRTWDAALHGIAVVISTHAVLADALTHSFVNIEELKLLIYDEAHWCTRKHPANRIMQDFYHPALKSKGQGMVPSILGLSASPSKPNGLKTIESNLNAIVKTPKVYREEMLRYAHRPKLHKIEFLPHSVSEGPIKSRTLQILCGSFPEVCNLIGSDLTSSASVPTDSNISSPASYRNQYIRKLFVKACHVYEELGPWAADYFVIESTKRLQTSTHDQLRGPAGPEYREKISLSEGLTVLLEDKSLIDLTIAPDYSTRLSPKLKSLISFLVREDKPEFSGLIFVQQRAAVGVLSKILCVHPETKDRFRCAGFVGLSNNLSRKIVGDLIDPAVQSHTLADFREGRKNLIVTTDALEEGIDIPACNFVVSYNNLPTLKSFVQRRGRARQHDSLFGIMVPQTDQSAFDAWQQLEEEMTAAYLSQLRLSHAAADLDRVDEEYGTEDVIRVPLTGAYITGDSAMAHLYHFCDKLPRQPYVDLRPSFRFREIDGLFQATVYLPNCLNAAVREKTGRRLWRTERAAAKDAALQAYRLLHERGLVNDNLLPLFHKEELSDEIAESLPSVVHGSAQLNPWISLAKAWALQKLYEVKVFARSLNEPTKTETSMSLIFPSVVPLLQPFTLFRSRTSSFEISVLEAKSISALAPHTLQLGRAITDLLLHSAHTNNRPSVRTDFVALLVPHTKFGQLTKWLDLHQGSQPAAAVLEQGRDAFPTGLLRSPLRQNTPHVFGRWAAAESGEGGDMVACAILPRRRNFLHRPELVKNPIGEEGATVVLDHTRLISLPISSCTFDRLPIHLALFSLFVPTILTKLEVALIATELSQSIVKDVDFQELEHVVTAISAPSAQLTSNYERYEFLGDCLLKFVVSAQLYVDHPSWHEGYLSTRRNSLVCNTRLATAALDTGLDAYVLTTPLLTRDWLAPTVSELLAKSVEPRKLSKKVLADVTEALVGAAFVDRGIQAAQSCIHVFLPDIRASPLSFRTSFPDEGKGLLRTANLDAAEEVIGYRFRERSIFLEALTHPSCQRDGFTESYQRLEFLGDAVLDMVVASALFGGGLKLSQGRMTQVKAALVNAHFLAYLAMELTLTQNTVGIYETTYATFEEQHGTKDLHLWQFMRHDSREITKAQQSCVQRYLSLRGDIDSSISQQKVYPWLLLTQLNADKFFSDLVEAVFGAIYVDSQGNLADCRRFAEQIGLLTYLRDFALETDSVDVTHPRSIVGRLAESQTVDYVVRHGGSTFYCDVVIGGTVLVTVGGCETKGEVLLMAAQRAVEQLSIESRDQGDQ